jgi:lipopolysaccharide/colanic/teichoic acid biosynthesis glycosyltransferase
MAWVIPFAWGFGGTVVKRLFDVVTSFLLLLVAMPFMVLAALMIRLTSPGPVLFRQERMGRGFRPFEIVKLRTMRHAQAGFAYTLGPDPRITAVGKFLRRSKLDEVPQLWNVLRGDMSLVGPRPVLAELTYEFREYYEVLLRARPGLTDPASLKYCQETRLLEQASDPFWFFKTVVTPDKIRMSIEYMNRASLRSDIEIVLMTIVICCIPSLSRRYGVLPVIVDPVGVRLDPVTPRWVPYTRKIDEAIFLHPLAMLETGEEESIHQLNLPWIPLPLSVFRPRSSASSVKGSATRL